MAYALIPDGYSLKKVTKLQKQAVNDKRRHDDIVALLNNPATPPVVLAPVILFLTGKLTEFILNYLKSEGVKITDDVVSNTKTAAEKVLETLQLKREGGFGPTNGVRSGEVGTRQTEKDFILTDLFDPSFYGLDLAKRRETPIRRTQ